MSSSYVRLALTASLCAGVATAFGCGTSTKPRSSEGGGGSTTATGGSAGTTATQGGEGGTGGFNPNTGGGGAGGEENCLTSEAEATTTPLDIIVLLDRSSSMKGALWDGTVNALGSFFNDPGGADISAALSYFPPPPDGAGQCQSSSYVPPHVPVTDIPANAAVLTTNIAGQSPTGKETPHYAALYGTLLYANQYQDDNPEHTVIVVLASDGDPTACDTSIANIAAVAATALDYNGVRTFAIAIQGATVANLDQIAAAGGTTAAFDVTNDVTQLKAKLEEIRSQLLDCEFTIPEPAEGEEFDATKLNVKYTPGGGKAQAIPQADDEQDCGDKQGWYYDNPTAPTKVFLCPQTCATVKADSQAKVSFVFGCPTVVN